MQDLVSDVTNAILRKLANIEENMPPETKQYSNDDFDEDDTKKIRPPGAHLNSGLRNSGIEDGIHPDNNGTILVGRS